MENQEQSFMFTPTHFIGHTPVIYYPMVRDENGVETEPMWLDEKGKRVVPNRHQGKPLLTPDQYWEHTNGVYDMPSELFMLCMEAYTERRGRAEGHGAIRECCAVCEDKEARMVRLYTIEDEKPVWREIYLPESVAVISQREELKDITIKGSPKDSNPTTGLVKETLDKIVDQA